jgi:HD-like signal output (HDOD) protein
MTEQAAPSRRRVLFVDDEPAILSSLKRLMHRERGSWDAAFANSGREAIAAFEQEPFDVVVSDMRMPEMDGADLLARIREQWPSTLRIILSGQTDPSAFVRALPTTHIFLNKPCAIATLRDALARCASVRGTSSVMVRAVLGRIDKLPSPPRLYLELTRLLENPRTNVDAIARLVSQDPSFVAKLLQVARSAAFLCTEETVSIDAAIRMLGIELLRAIAITSGLYGPARPPLAEDADRLQIASMRTATLARQFNGDRAKADVVYAAGLLHDIGHVVMINCLPDEYMKIRAARATGVPVLEAERQILGCDHAALGAHLLTMWGLSHELTDAVAFHHDPCSAPAEHRYAAAVVHAADVYAADERELLDVNCLEAVGLRRDVEAWNAFAST